MLEEVEGGGTGGCIIHDTLYCARWHRRDRPTL